MSYRLIGDEYYVYCPMFGKDIALGLCIEIDHATRGFLKKSCVPEISDWEKAEYECSKCENRD